MTMPSCPTHTAPARRLPPARSASPVVRYARERGISEHTARGEMMESVRRAALAIDAWARGGNDAAVAEALAMIDAVRPQAPVLSFADAEHAEALADAACDVAEAEYRRHPSRATKAAMLRASAVLAQAMEARDRALRTAGE